MAYVVEDFRFCPCNLLGYIYILVFIIDSILENNKIPFHCVPTGAKYKEFHKIHKQSLDEAKGGWLCGELESAHRAAPSTALGCWEDNEEEQGSILHWARRVTKWHGGHRQAHRNSQQQHSSAFLCRGKCTFQPMDPFPDGSVYLAVGDCELCKINSW